MQNRNPVVIPADISAKVDEIMSTSRLRFGHDAFRMEDPPAGPPDAPADPPKDALPADPPADDPPGSDSLGDAGKKALDAMKAERKAAREEAATLKVEFAAFKAKAEGKEAEYAAEQENQRVQAEYLKAADSKIVKSEVKAAAKGVLADPQDAYKFLDLSTFEVDSDGNVDEAAITKALADLVASKPYLAAQSGKRFLGTADGGARNDAALPSQLSKADIASMTPGEINKARREGRLDDLLRT